MKKLRKEFDKHFGLKYDLKVLRNLLEEEYQEFLDAENKIEKCDALIDMAYVLQQGINEFDHDVKTALIFPLSKSYDMFMNCIDDSVYYRMACLMQAIKFEYESLGFKKFEKAFEEVHKSNMSKLCNSEQEAITTIAIRQSEFGDCYKERIGKYWIVKCKKQNKVRKSINFKEPDLSKFV